MASSITAVLKDIQLMQPAEQRRIKVALDALIGGGSGNQPATTDSGEVDAREALFYETLSTGMYKTNRSKLPPLRVFKAGNHYKNMQYSLAALDDYLENLLGKSKIQRIQRAKFYQLFFKLTVEDLTRAEIPVNISTVLNTVERFPGLLDNAFPGYARNGLFLKVIVSKYLRN